MKNGTDHNKVQKYDKALTVKVMILEILNIDNMNCDWNIEDNSKR